jgi:hypothetical protein
MLNYINFDSKPTSKDPTLSDPEAQRRQLLSQILLQRGLQGERPKRWHSALVDALSLYKGANLAKENVAELKAQQDKNLADLATMLEGGRPQTWTNPDTGVEKSYGGLPGMIDAGLKIGNPHLLPQVQALQLEKYKTDYEQQLKANQPVKLGPNDTYFDPVKRQAIYTAPGKSNLLTPEEEEQKIRVGTKIAEARRRPSQQQVIQGDGGFYTVDKNASTATPILNERGEPILQSSLTPQVRAKINDKLITMQALKKQLETVKEKWAKIKDSSSAGAFGQGYIPTEAGKGFDAAVDALRPLFRQVSRTPGEGSMSDYETRLAQAPLPNRTQYESVTEQQIAQIEDMVAAIESGYQGMLGNANPTPSPGLPGAFDSSFDELPDPAAHKDRTILDDVTGKRLRSNGLKWVPIN